MGHILAKLENASLAVITDILKKDAPEHARQGMYLEHVWQNADNASEVLFLFRVDNLARARAYVEKNHQEARQKNPEANLPEMIFLE